MNSTAVAGRGDSNDPGPLNVAVPSPWKYSPSPSIDPDEVGIE